MANAYKPGSAVEMLVQQVQLSFRARRGKRDGAYHRAMVPALIRVIRVFSPKTPV